MYFEHITKSQGKELEAAVSADLILFAENWFLNPKVWRAYGARKREAIRKAHNNSDTLYGDGEGYYWSNKKANMPWWEHLKVPNRHQLNLFHHRPIE